MVLFPDPILAPNLEAFEYSRRDCRSESEVADFLQAVILQAPYLTYLSMAGIFMATTFDALPPFPNLKDLNLSLTEGGVFPMTFMTRCAGSMNCLETLELCLTPSTDVIPAFDGSPAHHRWFTFTYLFGSLNLALALSMLKLLPLSKASSETIDSMQRTNFEPYISQFGVPPPLPALSVSVPLT